MPANPAKIKISLPKTFWYYVNSLIALAFIVGFKYLPQIEPLTPLGMNIVGIFIGVIYAWSTVGIVWPALLGLIALGFSGYAAVPELFQKGYGGDTYLFVFFILIFAAIIDKAGVTEVIANWVISRKVARGRPWVLTTLLLSAAYLVAALVSVTPAVIICWDILYKLCQSFGYTRKDKYPKLMIVGIVFAGLMGQAALPYKVMAVMLMGVFTKQTGIEVDFVHFTILAASIGYFTVLGYVGMCRFIFRPDVHAIEQSNFIYTSALKLTRDQKKAIGLLIMLIVLLFLPGILPKDFMLSKLLTSLGNTGIVVLLLSFAVFFKRSDGTSFVNFVDLIHSGVPWQNLILLGTALPMAEAMTSAGTGVKELFVQILNPLFSAHIGANLFVFLFIGISILLTTFMGDVVVGLILIPLVNAYAPTIGVSSEILAVALCVSCLMGIVFPSASPLAALLHGNREWLSTTEIYRYTIALALLSTIIATLICLTLGRWLF